MEIKIDNAVHTTEQHGKIEEIEKYNEAKEKFRSDLYGLLSKLDINNKKIENNIEFPVDIVYKGKNYY